MLYRWLGHKPLQRWQNVFAQDRRGRSKPTGVETVEISQGTTFEPTAAEIHSFGDLMEPVGVSLHVAEPARQQVSESDGEAS